MSFDDYLILHCSNFDQACRDECFERILGGPSLPELSALLDHDWDEVDTLYLDHECIGAA